MSLLDAELPRGRRWARLGDFYEVTRKPRGLIGGDDQLPFLPMDAIPQGGAFEPMTYALKPAKSITSGTYVERGDLLVAKITPSFENGKQALIENLPTPYGYATTEVIPLRPKFRGQDRRLLFYYLLHPEVRSFVAERMEGTTGRQRVPEQVLLDLKLPELPEGEQSNIADVLDRVRLGVIVETQAEAAALELKRAAMRELFTRGLRGEPQKETEIGLVPESWELTRVNELASVKGGKRMPKGISLTTENTGRPYVRVTDFGHHTVRTEGMLFVPKGYEQVITRYRISSNDVYISIAGTIGLVGQVPRELNDANLTENAAKLVVRDDGIQSRYLMYSLASDACQRQISQSTAKNAQPKLALTRIEQVFVALPPTVEEQREIVAILDAIDRKIDLHRQKRMVLEQLFKALLHKLMTGAIRVADLDLSALDGKAAQAEATA